MKSKLIKRTVTTEEYIEPEQDSESETADDELDDEADGDDEETGDEGGRRRPLSGRRPR